jgi:hypothetical protein
MGIGDDAEIRAHLRMITGSTPHAGVRT